MSAPSPQVPIDVEPVPLLFQCFNGPCQGASVEAPSDASIGTACALPWKTIKGHERYAVYVLVNHYGQRGLMYLRSYDRPYQAQLKVNQLTIICAAAVA